MNNFALIPFCVLHVLCWGSCTIFSDTAADTIQDQQTRCATDHDCKAPNGACVRSNTDDSAAAGYPKYWSFLGSIGSMGLSDDEKTTGLCVYGTEKKVVRKQYERRLSDIMRRKEASKEGQGVSMDSTPILERRQRATSRKRILRSQGQGISEEAEDAVEEKPPLQRLMRELTRKQDELSSQLRMLESVEGLGDTEIAFSGATSDVPSMHFMPDYDDRPYYDAPGDDESSAIRGATLDYHVEIDPSNQDISRMAPQFGPRRRQINAYAQMLDDAPGVGLSSQDQPFFQPPNLTVNPNSFQPDTGYFAPAQIQPYQWKFGQEMPSTPWMHNPYVMPASPAIDEISITDNLCLPLRMDGPSCSVLVAYIQDVVSTALMASPCQEPQPCRPVMNCSNAGHQQQQAYHLNSTQQASFDKKLTPAVTPSIAQSQGYEQTSGEVRVSSVAIGGDRKAPEILDIQFRNMKQFKSRLTRNEPLPKDDFFAIIGKPCDADGPTYNACIEVQDVRNVRQVKMSGKESPAYLDTLACSHPDVDSGTVLLGCPKEPNQGLTTASTSTAGPGPQRRAGRFSGDGDFPEATIVPWSGNQNKDEEALNGQLPTSTRRSYRDAAVTIMTPDQQAGSKFVEATDENWLKPEVLSPSRPVSSPALLIEDMQKSSPLITSDELMKKAIAQMTSHGNPQENAEDGRRKPLRRKKKLSSAAQKLLKDLVEACKASVSAKNVSRRKVEGTPPFPISELPGLDLETFHDLCNLLKNLPLTAGEKVAASQGKPDETNVSHHEDPDEQIQKIKVSVPPGSLFIFNNFAQLDDKDPTEKLYALLCGSEASTGKLMKRKNQNEKEPVNQPSRIMIEACRQTVQEYLAKNGIDPDKKKRRRLIDEKQMP